MSAPHIILDCLPSLCQKLLEISRSYDKNNFAWFLRHDVQCHRFLRAVSGLVTFQEEWTCDPVAIVNIFDQHGTREIPPIESYK